MGNEIKIGETLGVDMPLDRDYQLGDNRTRTSGRIFLTGTQALTRMLVMQKKLDECDGLDTAGFVCGYRGSPLAAVDMEMWRSQKELDKHKVSFLPGINEDLAATVVMGTQQVGQDEKRTVDGVFAMWYGKGPGVDRAGDAIRHGNAAGTSRHGGVLMVVGDDHAATSSSIPHASDLSLMGWGIPIVNPSSVEEYEQFGLWGWAASRYSSTWVAFKAVSETVESGRSIEVPGLPFFNDPVGFESPVGSLEYRTNDFLTPAIEVRLAAKLQAVKAFSDANSIDRMVTAAPGARLGIVAVGKAYHDLIDALAQFGLSIPELERNGIRLYKPGLTFPLNHVRAAEFARGLKEVLVVEEKASVVEQQLKDIVYNWAERPLIAGKLDVDGSELITWIGQLRPALLAPPLARWLERVAPGLAKWDGACLGHPEIFSNQADGMKRLPYFCSGCPHNTSTKVPEGSVALAGVGCHYMASWMDRSTSGLTQMGGEGADWVGHALFTETPHVFQNMGEGTYFHSGFLAIRQAIAAGCTMTYKILFNDAVAMTGGQPVDGTMSVSQICQEMLAEGAKDVVVATDQPELYDGVNLGGVKVYHRRELDTLQRALREIKGVTVLIYDQTCAAEKRRRRKKNRPDRTVFPDPPKRLFINAAVCEGCGDCGVQSNCLSIAPLETPLGRKRQIDQSSCNKDYSCVEGFCPSFVTVHGGSLRKGKPQGADDAMGQRLQNIPMPRLPGLHVPYDMLVAGVGGTGVITVGQVVTMAAHLEGRGASVLDFTALAQKGGSVVSHIRIASDPDKLHAVRLEWQQAKLVMVCDLVVGNLPDVIGTIRQGATQLLVNSYVQPLAEFTRNADIDDRSDALLEKLTRAASAEKTISLDARKAATAVLGDAMATNMFMLGYAWQQAWVPVSLEALHRALELNGVSIEGNKKAFACGRLAAHDPFWLEGVAAPVTQVIQLQMPVAVDKVISHRRALLAEYQDERYARAYEEFIERVKRKESSTIAGKRLRLTEAVARSLYKLMAYKDEYEVARLYKDPAFMASLHEQFEGDFKLGFNLAPPMISRRNARGELVKKEFGPWMQRGFNVLANFKKLRGTPLDVFGYTPERRMERALIAGYRSTIETLLLNLNQENMARAIEIAHLPEAIRGYGHIKERAVARYHAQLEELTSQFAD